jgi:hypothetical protein
MPSERDDRGGAASFVQRAEDNLLFIRRTMERTSTFTAVPGLGGAGMGVVGVAAAIVAARQPSPDRWLAVWLVAAAVAAPGGGVAMWRKATGTSTPLAGVVGRRFALGMAAPFVAAAAITYALWRAGDYGVMAPTWLLLYGAGVVIGGLFSVPVVRAIGVCFMATGVAAIVTPQSWGNSWLGVGFGGLQIAFGIHIARHHGG